MSDPTDYGWVRVRPDDPALQDAADRGLVRAEELIRLVLLGRHIEAETLLGTVPQHELYALTSALIAHASRAYREGIGVMSALALLAHMKGK